MRLLKPTLLALATSVLALPVERDVTNDVLHPDLPSTAWKREAVPQGCDDPINRRDPMCAWKRDSESEEVESGLAWKRQSCTGPIDERDVEMCAWKRELEKRQTCTGPIDERDVEMCAWKREADARDMPKSW